MPERRIGREEYGALLARDVVDGLPADVLNHLGLLIDAAHAFRDAAGTQRALMLAGGLDTRVGLLATGPHCISS